METIFFPFECEKPLRLSFYKLITSNESENSFLSDYSLSFTWLCTDHPGSAFSLSYICVFCVHAVFVTWGLHAVYSVRRRLSCSFFFPSSLCLPVYVCLMCVSCNVWCVSVAFNKVTGWIASTLKPSTWPQRRSGNLNASFPFLLWKYLPLAGKNTYTPHPFTPGVWGYPPSTGFPSVGNKSFKQLLFEAEMRRKNNLLLLCHCSFF